MPHEITKRERRLLVVFLSLSSLIVLLFVAILVLFQTIWVQDLIRRSVEKTAAVAWSAQIRYDRLNLGFKGFRPAVSLENLSIAFKQSPQNVAEVSKLEVVFSPMQSMFGKIMIDRLSVSQGRVEIRDVEALRQVIQSLRRPSRWVDRKRLLKAEIDEVEINDVALSLPDFRHVATKQSYIKRAVIRNSDGRVDISELEFTFDGVLLGKYEQKIEIYKLKSKIAFPAIDVRELRMRSGDGDMALSGKLNFKDPTNPNGRLQLQAEVSESLLLRFFHPQNFSVGNVGRVSVKAEVSGELRDPTVSAALNGENLSLNGLAVQRFKTNLTLQNKQVQIADTELESNFGSMTIAGGFNLDGKKGTIAAHLSDVMPFDVMRQFGIGTHLFGKVSGDVNGSVSLNSPYFDGKSLLHISAFKIFSKRNLEIGTVEQVDVDTDVKVEKAAIGVKGSVAVPGIDFDVDASFGFGDSMRITYQSVFKDMGKPLGNLFERPVRGAGKLRGSISGLYRNPTVENIFDFDHFAYGDLPLDRMSGVLLFRDDKLVGIDLGSNTPDYGVKVNGGIDFSPLDHNDFHELKFAVRDYDLAKIVRFIDGDLDLEQQLNMKITAQGQLFGPIKKMSGLVIVESKRPLLFQKMPIDSCSANLRITNGEIEFKDFSIFFDDQKTEVFKIRGILNLSGKHGLTFYGDNLNIRRILPFPYFERLNLQSRISVKGGLKGTFSEPLLNMSLGAVDSSISYSPLGDSRVLLSLSRKRVRYKGRLFGERVKLDGSVDLIRSPRGFPYMMRFQFADMDLYPWLPPFAGGGPLLGVRDGRFMVRGRYGMRGHWGGDGGGTVDFQRAELDRFELARGQYRLALVKPAMFQISQGVVELSPFVLREGDHTLEVRQVEGVQNRLRISGNVSLVVLTLFVDEISRAEGVASLDVTVDGLARKPLLSGLLEISDSLFIFKTLKMSLARVSVRVDIIQNLWRIEGLKGEVSGGSFKGGGQLFFDGFKLINCEQRIDLDSVGLPKTMDASGALSGQLVLTRAKEAFRLTGDLGLYRGRYTKTFNFSDLLLKEHRKNFNVTSGGGQALLLFNVRLRTKEPFKLNNNVVAADITANLELTGTEKSLGALGEITIEDGRFFYYGNTFTISSGHIALTSKTGFAPQYDIIGETEIRAYKVTLHAVGDPENQRLLVSSTPVLSQKDVLSLVQFGVVASESKELTIDRTSTFEGMALGFGLLKERLGAEEFLKRRFHIIDKLQLFPVYSETTKQTELMLTVGMGVVPNLLELNYSRFVSAVQTEDQVGFDLMLHRNISFLGSWKNEPEGGNYGDFGADVRFRFEFE